MTDRESWGARILRVIDYIHAHRAEEIDPQILADIAGLSLHHFHRVFRGMVGESVMGFVRRLRLERAAQRLRFDDVSVTNVAFEAGYGSHEAFTRAFRARFGQSPSAYRMHGRAALPVPEVAFRDEPERVCLSWRYVGDYDECGKVWDELMGELGRRGLIASIKTSLGLAYDDPEVTDTSKLRYDACVELPADTWPFVLPEGCTRRVIPGGRYATTIHRGPYETILETYVALIGRYLPFHDVELANDPVVEIYVVSPYEAPSEELITEVCVRVA